VPGQRRAEQESHRELGDDLFTQALRTYYRQLPRETLYDAHLTPRMIGSPVATSRIAAVLRGCLPRSDVATAIPSWMICMCWIPGDVLRWDRPVCAAGCLGAPGWAVLRLAEPVS
jgi:hypothetical protein